MSEMPEQPRIIYPSVEVLPRELDSGMGQAVAERTILRKKDDGSFETWGDVAKRVAVGNTMLDPEYGPNDVDNLYAHISKATLLMSGRHLQHGDENQIMRNIDAFSNCSTSATTFGLFYLLLNGSGVGRSYDDALMLVDWSKAPSVVCVLDEDHPDFDSSIHKTPDWAKAIYSYDQTEWFMVPDSREGWAKAVEIWETMAFAGDKSDFVLILDFSEVRMKGSPIAGMQNRPSSGPVPLMLAFERAMEICNTSMDNWMQAMFIDHYFAECVVVGGARRAARLAAKSWKDKSVIEFIKIKSSNSDVKLIHGIDTFLWSANNSVLSDEDFWDIINNDADHELKDHAKAVWEETTKAAYFDGTGEPAFINADKLTRNDEGLKEYVDGKYVGYWKYKIDENTSYLMSQLAVAANGMDNNMIVNPCGEIPLHVLSGLCVIADTVPFHASTIREGEDAFRAAARGLIRVNLMKGLYSREVQRTNRIGVGITGIHEFAWKFFKVGFRALVSPNFDEYMDFVNAAGNINDAMNHEDAGVRAAAFWLTMNRFGRAAIEEADSYAEKLGVVKPHTCLTVKPSGSVSKLFGLTEGVHLSSMAYYLRWVQFRNGDPLIEEYKEAGYPVKELKSYNDTTVIGFPTAPTISKIGMGDELVTAGDATPEEQYKWLMLLEKFYLIGVDPNTMEPLHDRGGQVSYTLKYKPSKVSYETFVDMMKKYQPKIKCCSVMPQTEDTSVYEYLPEEPISEARYNELMENIHNTTISEDIGQEHVECEGGACPIDFSNVAKSNL